MDPRQQPPQQPQQPIPNKDVPRLTGLKKRQQIEVAGRVVFIWIAVAAAALSFCAATGQFLLAKWLHNNKVIAAKYQAIDTLSSSLGNAKELTQEVDALVANEALGSVKTDVADPNTKSVLDALPTTFDPAALATSLQQAILNRSGVGIDNISVPQEVGEATPVVESIPQEMAFSFTVSGNYDQIKQAVLDVERTIRPMRITNFNLVGSDQDLRASVDAVTYYQPAKSVEVKKETIK